MKLSYYSALGLVLLCISLCLSSTYAAVACAEGKSCGNYLCDDTTGDCLESCEASTSCVTGAQCNSEKVCSTNGDYTEVTYKFKDSVQDLTSISAVLSLINKACNVTPEVQGGYENGRDNKTFVVVYTRFDHSACKFDTWSDDVEAAGFKGASEPSFSDVTYPLVCYADSTKPLCKTDNDSCPKCENGQTCRINANCGSGNCSTAAESTAETEVKVCTSSAYTYGGIVFAFVLSTLLGITLF